LAKWLEPNGKVLPNINVRKAVFDSLLDMPVKGIVSKMKNNEEFSGIEVHHLKESGIAKIINFYSQNVQETEENKKKTKTLIERWSRLVFDLSDNYKNLEMKEKESQKKSNVDYFKYEPKKKKSNLRAVVPRLSGFDYDIRPTKQDPSERKVYGEYLNDDQILKNLGLDYKKKK
jgi:hypothetical protein